MKKVFVFGFLFLSIVGYSQGHDWWVEKHNWDRVSPWSDYIIFSPAYLGPNALPVPDSKNGKLPQNMHFELSFDSHFSKGDNTKNAFSELYFPLFSDKAGLNISYIPVEYYKMDTLTRDLRRSRDFDGEGISAGDFYVSTFIQLLKDMDKFPDVLVTVNLKTASGSNLEAARNTDSPGYFFDCSVGKDFKIENSFLKLIRPHGMLGFYSWQLNRVDYFQNDALLYGFGLDIHFSKFKIENSLDGYSGYINNGDKPIVFRSILKSKLESDFNYKIMFQHGIRDFPYNTLRVGFEINLEKVVKKSNSKH